MNKSTSNSKPQSDALVVPRRTHYQQEDDNLWKILTGCEATDINNLTAAASTPMLDDPDGGTTMVETVYQAFKKVVQNCPVTLKILQHKSLRDFYKLI